MRRPSAVDILRISPRGFRLRVAGQEYRVPYREFPWFRRARPSEIARVELLHGHHLRWDRLDVDLEITSLARPERCPLKYR